MEEEVMIVNDNNIPKNHHTKGEASALSKFQPVMSRVKSKIQFFNSKSEVGDVDPTTLCAKLDPIKTVKRFRVVHKDLLKFDQYQILGFPLGPPLTSQQQLTMKEIVSTPIQAS